LVFDLIVHRHDLPAGRRRRKVGFGLWNQLPAVIPLEMGLLLAACDLPGADQPPASWAESLRGSCSACCLSYSPSLVHTARKRPRHALGDGSRRIWDWRSSGCWIGLGINRPPRRHCASRSRPPNFALHRLERPVHQRQPQQPRQIHRPR
jgi:hypothetical protein